MPQNRVFSLVIANTVIVLCAIGVLVYTRVIFKRPEITEASERARLALIRERSRVPAPPAYVDFEPVTINIAQAAQDKLHYVTMGFAVELEKESGKGDLEKVRPVLMDQVLAVVGRKSFQDLTTVQGRYLLRQEMLALANHIPNSPVVTNVYFTQFVVQ